MSETAVSANRLELLQIADAVARDKSIEKSLVLSAMEDAIQRAARSRYGAENDIRAQIDPKTGVFAVTDPECLTAAFREIHGPWIAITGARSEHAHVYALYRRNMIIEWMAEKGSVTLDSWRAKDAEVHIL